MANGQLAEALAKGNPLVTMGLEVGDALAQLRPARGETVKSTFVGIEKADIVSADVKDSEAVITLRILSQLISATYDKAGAVIDGDAEAVSEVNDLWTFARDTRSRDPNWKLIATESEG